MSFTKELRETAIALVAPGKGILAADESTGTIKKRFDKISVVSTLEARRDYRELLFTAPGITEYISGVICYDETMRTMGKTGKSLPKILADQGVIPGIKVDMGTQDLPFHPGELTTEGLDGLGTRLAEYRTMGAKFAKWRAVININENTGLPTDTCLEANAHSLAMYAALCQQAGIVPIVEPEVIMDGSHSIETCYNVTSRALQKVFAELFAHRVDLEGILLKPNMVVSGTTCTKQADIQTVATMTVKCLMAHVPAAVPGIVFLSGGQSDELATVHLNAMNKTFAGKMPWKLSFSYGRALQTGALNAWLGKDANVPSAQKAFMQRSKLNSAAAYGRYENAMEKN
jgi:fructose-bisphosphate aldolase class I